MKKIVYAAAKKGGKTKWIIENIIKECMAGKTCYYMGGRKTYENICELISKEDPLKYVPENTAEIPELNFVLINKDNNPQNEKSAVFTDDLVWEIANIHPVAVRNLFNLDIKWYITLNTEQAVNKNQISNS